MDATDTKLTTTAALLCLCFVLQSYSTWNETSLLKAKFSGRRRKFSGRTFKFMEHIKKEKQTSPAAFKWQGIWTRVLKLIYGLEI